MRLLQFLFGIALALCALDGLSWHILDRPPYQLDSDLGPLRRDQRVVWGLEGYGVSHWLEHGVRDNGNGSIPNARRILVMGDSYTEALQVYDRETFCSLAEARLREQGWPVELLNVGQSDRSPADYVQLGPAYLRCFRPDWVVLVLDAWDFTGDGWAPYKRHFSRQNGKLVVEGGGDAGVGPSPRGGFLAGLSGLTKRRLDEFGARWAEQPPLFEAAQAPPVEVVPDYPLEEVVASLRATFGKRCTLVYIAPFQPGGAPDRSVLEERFFAACRRESLDLIDLTEWHPWLRQQGYASQGFANSRWNKGHANIWGHRMMARALVDHLNQLRPQIDR